MVNNSTIPVWKTTKRKAKVEVQLVTGHEGRVCVRVCVDV